MDSDIEQKIKDKLLESLIEAMEDRMADGIAPKHKGMEVAVAAPDKDKLAEGLDHARELVAGDKHPDEEKGDEMSDEDRLRELMEDEGDHGPAGDDDAADEEDDEKDDEKDKFGRR